MPRFSPRPNQAHRVQWREWGEDAFREARAHGKPIVLFITAFWCGVCQRLDEAALSSEEVIALLNAYFVPIRVEEAQRPDVDLRYNQGGWPTIVFLAPDGDLLFSLNYLDGEAFADLLVRVVEAYQRNPPPAPEPAALPSAEPPEPAPLGLSVVAEIAGMVEGLADRVHGGFGGDDKLFHTDALEFLLYLYETTGERGYLDHVLLTLERMRASRTWDTSEGGFFRYSSRRDWQEPHPEKLLDDQAALLTCYLRAYLLTESAACRATAEEILAYLEGTLLDRDQGVFFGCQDYVRLDDGRGPERLTSTIDRCIYCDANARAASACFGAWWLLGRQECQERAASVLDWLWKRLRAPDGAMYHYWDSRQHVPGMLMDAVRTGTALLDAYAALGDAIWLARARELAGAIVRRHRNPAGGFFDIAQPGPGALRVRMAVLSQNATLAAFFIRLAGLSEEQTYRDWARWALLPFPNAHRQYGAFAAGFGHALAQLLAPSVGITVRGRPGEPEVRRLLREAGRQVAPRVPAVRFHLAAPGEATGITIAPAAPQGQGRA